MSNIKSTSVVAMALMLVLSFTNLFGANIAGASVILGVVFFFINKALEKQDSGESGLDFRAIGSNLKGSGIWLWFALPFIMDIFSVGLSKLVVPEFLQFELARTGSFVSLDKIPFMIIQLLILALGEEIAWRAFFQKQMIRVLPLTPTLLISSALFALGHWTILPGMSLAVVIYSVFFVFINSILYGVIFHKTNNAWVSTISHFVANLLSVLFMPMFL